jgi:hypothetical protein
MLAAGQSATPDALDDATFAAVRAHASPTARDLAFQQIDWKNTVYEGVSEAQRADKPVLMWLYFGDPRGHC